MVQQVRYRMKGKMRKDILLSFNFIDSLLIIAKGVTMSRATTPLTITEIHSTTTTTSSTATLSEQSLT